MPAPRSIFVPLVLVALVGATSMTGQATGAPLPVHAPKPSQRFVDSVGVNVQAGGSETSYADWSRVVSSLRRLGVRHVRVPLAFDPVTVAKYDQLASSGIGLDVIASAGRDTSEANVARITNQLTHFARSLDTIEGPNEWDGMYGSDDWPQRLAEFQYRLYRAVKAEPRLAGIPVLGPSFADVGRIPLVPPIRTAMDQANLHSYPFGSPPEWTIDYFINASTTYFGRRPMQVTETGYHTSMHRPWFQPPANAAATSRYIPRLYAENFRRGIIRTYLWQLLDTPAPPGWPDQEAHFGLLKSNHADKPGATTLRRLIALTRDSTASFRTTPLPLRISGPDDTRSTLLQRSNGDYLLLLWRATRMWDPVRLRPVDPGRPRVVGITVGGTRRIAFVNPARPLRWIVPNRRATARATTRVAVGVGSDLLVLRIRAVPAPRR